MPYCSIITIFILNNAWANKPVTRESRSKEQKGSRLSVREAAVPLVQDAPSRI